MSLNYPNESQKNIPIEKVEALEIPIKSPV